MIDAILDPSAIYTRRKLEMFVELAEQHASDVEIYLPSVFFRLHTLNERQLESIEMFFKTPGQERIDFRFFLGEVELGRLRNVRQAPDFEMHFYEHSDFLENLKREVADPDVYEILAEEWVFMNEYSFIAARTRRGFDKFLKAGASYLMIGKKSMEKSLSLAVNKPNRYPFDAPITAYSIFRASCKYVAAAGSSIGTTVISGGVGIGVAAASGLFLIMDP